jgi:hypothetical protein
LFDGSIIPGSERDTMSPKSAVRAFKTLPHSRNNEEDSERTLFVRKATITKRICTDIGTQYPYNGPVTRKPSKIKVDRLIFYSL